jgi:hypothetical protein
MEIDFSKLTDKQVEAIVDRLFPVIRSKMTLRSEVTPFGQCVKGFGDMHELNIKSKRIGQTEIANPLKRPLNGFLVVQGDSQASIKLNKNGAKKIIFDTSVLGEGKKVKVLVY